MAEVMKIAISTITFTLKKTNEGDMWQKNKRLFFRFILSNIIIIIIC
jgi:hypothetical protein